MIVKKAYQMITDMPINICTHNLFEVTYALFIFVYF
jgi:hypothetical protein